jgi:hypothetical protein
MGIGQLFSGASKLFGGLWGRTSQAAGKAGQVALGVTAATTVGGVATGALGLADATLNGGRVTSGIVESLNNALGSGAARAQPQIQGQGFYSIIEEISKFVMRLTNGEYGVGIANWARAAQEKNALTNEEIARISGARQHNPNIPPSGMDTTTPAVTAGVGAGLASARFNALSAVTAGSTIAGAARGSVLGAAVVGPAIEFGTSLYQGQGLNASASDAVKVLPFADAVAQASNGRTGAAAQSATVDGATLAGGIGGAWAGAAVGAVAGSFVPFVGTAIGGVVGGVAGSLGGSFGLRSLASSALSYTFGNAADPAPAQPQLVQRPAIAPAIAPVNP